jgi:hypothetical protein
VWNIRVYYTARYMFALTSYSGKEVAIFDKYKLLKFIHLIYIFVRISYVRKMYINLMQFFASQTNTPLARGMLENICWDFRVILITNIWAKRWTDYKKYLRSVQLCCSRVRILRNMSRKKKRKNKLARWTIELYFSSMSTRNFSMEVIRENTVVRVPRLAVCKAKVRRYVNFLKEISFP